jgi:hypothetical protein
MEVSMKLKLFLTVVLTLLSVVAHSQAIQWRLVGTSTNFERNVTSCFYEGRTADGTTVTATRFVRGFVCPLMP